MEPWTGGARQLDASQYFHAVRHSRRSTFSNALWMVSDKMATKLWKNTWDVTAINTDFSAALHCDPCQGGVRLFFSARSMVTSDPSASRWGPVGGGERGPDGKFLSHLCVQWGVVASVSGDTQISWHVQRFSVYFETCRRLCRGEECSLSLVLSVQSDKTLSMRLICFNAQPTICVPLQSLSLYAIWLHSGVSGSNWSWQSCVMRGGDALQYACFI